jgi:CRM1 / Exportin repeat 2
VLIVEDENGEIVRETTRDTEAIAQYKTMRETLVYLTHLHYEDTESIMLDKLAMQVSATATAHYSKLHIYVEKDALRWRTQFIKDSKTTMFILLFKS